MVPVSFDGCAGWLHEARGSRGVILCGSMGFEDLCGHRSMAILAEKIARAGQPALRFDYYGCGDSAGGWEEAGLVERWRGNLRAAIAFLKNSAGVVEIALIGLRVGSLLAAEAAAECGAARLVLIAPPSSGKAWARELKAFAGLTGGGALEDDAGPGALSVAGFRMTAETLTGLRGMEPALIARPPAGSVLALGRHAGVKPALASHLSSLGCDVECEAFEGYDAMMCDPTASVTPHAALGRIAGWITQGAGAGALRSACGAAPVTGPGFSESRIGLGADANLAGVWCGPISGPASQAVIFVNAGAIHHIGWARGQVDMARGLAARGIASLRMDFGGLGDSFAARGDRSVSLYTDARKADVSTAIDWIAARGFHDITVAGACSGAYHAMQAGLTDRRITRLALINQLCFVWGARYSIQLAAWQATRAAVVNAGLGAGSGNAGEAARHLNKLIPIAKKFAKGSFNALMNLKDMAERGFSSRNPVEDWFETLSARGAQVSMIYSDGDAGLSELERWLGTNGARATALPGIETHTIERADHMLTPQAARDALLGHMLGLLGTKTLGEKAQAAA